ncbi:RluA family pseudouridine synthase [Helicobacter sp. 23-1044]
MPFIREKFTLDSPKKATIFLQQTLKITHKEAQKMIDKGRVECNGAIFSQKAGFLSSEIIVNHFRAEATELKPIFETADFAVFDKPAGLLTHPKGRFSHASLLDSIRFHLGANANPINRLDSETSGLVIVSKNKKSEVILKRHFEMREVEKNYLAVVFGRVEKSKFSPSLAEGDLGGGLNPQNINNVKFANYNELDSANRTKNAESNIDCHDSAIAESRNDEINAESNAKNKQSKRLRCCFGLFSRETSKIGLIRPSSAVLCENNSNEYPRPNCPQDADFIINLPLKDGQKGVDLGIRTCIDKNGRFAQSAIKILHYDSARNITHLKIMPLTGRTHQIRAHLAHIGHRIVGEMLYGVDDKNARDFLDGKINGEARTQIFGANRLMLHAQSLRFCYQNNEFFIRSKMPFSLPPNSHFVDCDF